MQTCRRELLDRTLIWNQAHLLHALREFEQFYNCHRPHQGIANFRPLRALPAPVPELVAATSEPIRAHRLVEGRRAIGARGVALLVQGGLAAADGQKYPHQFSGGQRQRI